MGTVFEFMFTQTQYDKLGKTIIGHGPTQTDTDTNSLMTGRLVQP